MMRLGLRLRGMAEGESEAEAEAEGWGREPLGCTIKKPVSHAFAV